MISKWVGEMRQFLREDLKMADKTVLEIFEELIELHKAKDADYGGDVPLSNFRRCEQFGIPAWKGCLVRMSDKWSRLLSLVAKDGKSSVTDENIEDTLKDLAVYSVIVLALLRHGDPVPTVIFPAPRDFSGDEGFNYAGIET